MMITQWWRRRRGGPMSCHDIARVMQRYLDSEIEDDVAAGVAAHLEDCRRCGLDADVYRAIKSSIARRQQPFPEDALVRVREFAEGLVAHPY